MPAAEKSSPDKLSIVVFSGAFDKVHYALAMAAASIATNVPATLFFTMGAIRALERPLADGSPAWARLPGAGMDAGFKGRGIATFEELLDSCVALGVTFMVCEMGLRAMDIPPDRLRPDVPVAIGGLVTFQTDASRNGTMVFI